MLKLLKLFVLLFCPSVDGDPEESVDPVDPEEAVDLDDDPVDPVDPEENDDPEPEPKPVSRAQKEIISLRERAQKAEDQHRQAMAELEAARREKTQATAKPTHEQQLWEQEEEILKNPNAESWQKYSVQSARDARSALNESRAATRSAQDLADKNAFERLSVSKPKTYAAYAPKVEEMLTSMRKNGNNAPREELFALLVGRDIIKGNLKAETKSTKPAGELRGKTPGAKSDVSSGGSKLSDAEKRAKRLENVRI